MQIVISFIFYIINTDTCCLETNGKVIKGIPLHKSTVNSQSQEKEEGFLREGGKYRC